MSTALDNSMLTLVTFIPLAGAILLLLFPRRDRDIRVFALVVSLAGVCSLVALAGAFSARAKRISIRNQQPLDFES